MKHFKKILTFIALLAMTGGVYSANLGVSQIDVLDAVTLKVTLSENPNLEVGDQDAEITVLQDVNLYGGFAVMDAANKVELILEDALLVNTSYSLLTVLGSEGSMEFITPESIEGHTVSNITNVSEQDIDMIEIIDDRTIHITYTQDLVETAFEYKLLAESMVTRIEKRDYDVPELHITVEPPFIAGRDYILMFIDMQDVDGNYIEFDTGIYDFSTPEAVIEEETGTGTIMEDEIIIEDEEETATGSIVEDENREDTIEAGSGAITEEVEENTDEEEIINLEAAGEEDTIEAGSGAITEEVAMTAETTPDTGAATWVLILSTLIINTFYYSARRKRV